MSEQCVKNMERPRTKTMGQCSIRCSLDVDKTNIPEYSFAHATAKELPTDFVQVVEFAFRGEKNMKIAAVMIREGWSMKQVADTLKDLVTLLETE